MTELERLISCCAKNGRVCPMPLPWHQVWDMLPSKKHHSAEWDPPVPPVFAAWWLTSDKLKRDLFEQHLHWATADGVLDAVAGYLRSLPESEWHHRGE